MKLDTIKKAEKFIKELGTLEFSFICDGVATFNNSIPKMVNGIIYNYEVRFFIEECDVFYRLDSMDGFLSNLAIFEIEQKCDEESEYETVYHRKYNSDVIINSEKEVVDSMDDIFLKGESLMINTDDEARLLRHEQKLKEVLLIEDYDMASLLRDKIKKLKNKLK